MRTERRGVYHAEVKVGSISLARSGDSTICVRGIRVTITIRGRNRCEMRARLLPSCE